MGYWCTQAKFLKIVETKRWMQAGSPPNTSLPPDEDYTKTTVTDQLNSCEDEKCPNGYMQVKVYEHPFNSSWLASETQTSWTETEQNVDKTFLKLYFVEKVITRYGMEGVDYQYACIEKEHFREFQETFQKIAKYIT